MHTHTHVHTHMLAQCNHMLCRLIKYRCMFKANTNQQINKLIQQCVIYRSCKCSSVNVVKYRTVIYGRKLQAMLRWNFVGLLIIQWFVVYLQYGDCSIRFNLTIATWTYPGATSRVWIAINLHILTSECSILLLFTKHFTFIRSCNYGYIGITFVYVFLRRWFGDTVAGVCAVCGRYWDITEKRQPAYDRHTERQVVSRRRDV